MKVLDNPPLIYNAYVYIYTFSMILMYFTPYIPVHCSTFREDLNHITCRSSAWVSENDHTKDTPSNFIRFTIKTLPLKQLHI